MACAARLASKGHTVTVFEHNETWGGKLGYAEHDGYKFDTGPSLLTLPAVYRDLFLKTGAAIEDSIEIVDLETAFLFPWGVALRDIGWLGYASMVIFLLEFIVGFVYIWKKGALDWE